MRSISQEIDGALSALDGTRTKARLGANALLAVPPARAARRPFLELPLTNILVVLTRARCRFR